MRLAYFEKNKQSIFPEIVDWSDPQNQYRLNDDVRHMPYKYWAFFHPSAYKLVMFSLPILAIVLFGGLAFLSYAKDVKVLAAFLALIAVLQVYDLIKKIKNYSLMRDTNFYDIFMREY